MLGKCSAWLFCAPKSSEALQRALGCVLVSNSQFLLLQFLFRQTTTDFFLLLEINPAVRAAVLAP